jgi:hypothetical protein
MNKENFEELIELMKTVPSVEFDIGQWTHDCGTPSCVAGWATATPSWQRHGELTIFGPEYKGENHTRAFALWAEIPLSDAKSMCATKSPGFAKDFYGTRDVIDIKPEQVVVALTKYLDAHNG